jgi:ribonuclease BN (tRNA processing enzyme)
MEIRVLGCHGSQLPGYNTTSFLLDKSILVDAGTVTSLLGLEDQINIDYILVTHAHLDHVKDIAFLADNLHLKREHPIDIVTTQGIIDILRANLFNNVIWPDFTVIPTPEDPIIRFRAIEPGVTFPLNSVNVTAIGVNHTIETVAYMIEYEGGSVIFVGDTGPTETIWSIANTLKNLKAVFIETSFPDSLQDIADAAGHFTPRSFNRELEKLSHQTPNIYLYHLKPQYQDVIEKEISAIDRNNVSILKEGQIIQV